MNRRGVRALGKELARASNLVRVLDRDLDRARDLIRGARARDLRDLIYDYDVALIRDLDVARDLIRDLIYDYDVAVTRALGLTRDLDVARVLDRAIALTRDLRLARVLTRKLARVLDLHRALACEPARDLVRVLDHALKRLRTLDQKSVAPTEGACFPAGRVSWGLVALAVLLLPAEHRPRYGAEFRGELVESQRQEQWKYAMRVLISVWELRRALVAAARTPDDDMARLVEQ